MLDCFLKMGICPFSLVIQRINWSANVCRGSSPMHQRSGILVIFQMGASEIRCHVAKTICFFPYSRRLGTIPIVNLQPKTTRLAKRSALAVAIVKLMYLKGTMIALFSRGSKLISKNMTKITNISCSYVWQHLIQVPILFTRVFLILLSLKLQPLAVFYIQHTPYSFTSQLKCRHS